MNTSDSDTDLSTPKPATPKLRYIALSIFLGLCLTVAFGAFRSETVFAVPSFSAYDDLEVFADVLTLIENNYVDEVDSRKLIEGAIKGMLDTLDPHSSYMSAETYHEMQVETEGEFGGLGIEITMDGGWLTVVTAMDETPAAKAGLKSGDKIIKVEGELTHDMTLMDSVKKMRGKKGTPVTITVIREGWEEPKDYTIIRDTIQVQSVRFTMLPDNWGYARIRSFTADVGAELRAAITELRKDGMKGLVLDLRNDPGGLLDQAVEVSESFLKKGSLVVYTKGRLSSQNMRLTASSNNANTDSPMVVLVNEGSASASEIVAGALQDHKRAIIVGVPTFGKASVQTIIPLKGDAGLRLTTARYYTPSGQQIQGVGINPDILVEAVEISDEAIEAVKKRNTLREKDLKNSLTPKGGVVNGKGTDDGEETDLHFSTNVVNLERDIQLQRAIAVLKSWEIVRIVEEAQRSASVGVAATH
jgi:carboxyl-terminal processing protease